MSKTPQTPRAAIHDTAVHFRAKASIVEAAVALADKRGMSLAELMRHAMRRELDAAFTASAPNTGKLRKKPTTIKRAAGETSTRSASC